MSRTAMLAALIATTFLATIGPATAYVSVNGGGENGIRYNGVKYNGIKYNGTTTSGVTLLAIEIPADQE
ncbi:MAG: hypothetical protein KF889_10605 [Alphaproteobacteria bacterium]|nr:hypothetical protein [Alphaproteobacteria bacterium]MCW5741274.1 hypothetical protein [Alphaproteobacteria bacterium]